jgi:serine/threonine protein kinase
VPDPLFSRVVSALGAQYELDGEIGRGGMAVVYRARDVRLNRTVAVKVLPPELAYDPAIRMRFTREAQTSAQLAHGHIVPIFDVGDRDGIAYFVMALITGGNLATLLEHEPHQPADEVRRILSEVADALAYAHLRGVIHRDVKPDNILLDGQTGRALVTDFGIARAMESNSRLTATGNAVGTPTYMSPEQAMGDREIDGRADVYSLGVLGYQMLTGRVPFAAGNPMALLLKQVSERPRPISELRPDVPDALRDAIERAMMKAPEDRWSSAAALRDALATDRAPSPAWRPERRDPVRYASPRPASARIEQRHASPRRGSPAADAAAVSPVVQQSGIVLEPPHLAALTPEQRADLRLWHGRVNLLDRIKTMRRYTLFTVTAAIAAMPAVVVGAEHIPPLVLAPIVPLFMSVKLWKRGLSLRASGLRLRRVLLSPRSRWVIPGARLVPTEQQLAKLAPREVLESPSGAAIRRAAADRAAILDIVAGLSKADQALVPDVKPTANALVDRVVQLAQSLHRLDGGLDAGLAHEIDMKMQEARGHAHTPEGERQLALLRRQRAAVDELAQHRAALARQLDSAGLALGNLRLDLMRLRSSGLQSGFSAVSSATQEARAIAREIDVVLEAATEAREV